MAQNVIRTERAGRVETVTIDRPPVNALNSDAYFELLRVMHDLAIDDEVSVAVLTGAGERAFAAGADVREFTKFNSRTGMVYTKKNTDVREFIRTFPKPVICAVNGLAYGGGCALALACDIRIASSASKWNLSEINMGILGGIPYAASIIASGTARKMIFSGESLSAEEALRVGLVDEVVSPERLMERGLALAEKIAAKPPVALRKAKEVLIASSRGFLEDTLAAELRAVQELWGTADKNEAVTAFLEKRSPVFQGK